MNQLRVKFTCLLIKFTRIFTTREASQDLLAVKGIKPEMAEWKARTLPLCYAVSTALLFWRRLVLLFIRLQLWVENPC